MPFIVERSLLRQRRPRWFPLKLRLQRSGDGPGSLPCMGEKRDGDRHGNSSCTLDAWRILVEAGTSGRVMKDNGAVEPVGRPKAATAGDDVIIDDRTSHRSQGAR